jgi:hypothetical protein
VRFRPKLRQRFASRFVLAGFLELLGKTTGEFSLFIEGEVATLALERC